MASQIKDFTVEIPPTKPQILKDITDLGVAQTLLRMFSGRVFYLKSLNRWAAWDGERWELEAGDIISERFYRELCRRGREEAFSLASEQDGGKPDWIALSKGLQSARKQSSVLRMARSERGILINVNEFDADAYLLGATNGVVDLRSGMLLTAKPNLMVSKAVNVAYEPEATCPTWDKFRLDIAGGDDELAEYLQHVAARCISGDTRQRQFWVFYGSGANGKSTFIDVLCTLLGDDYAQKLSNSALSTKRFASGHNEDVAVLRGKRLGCLSEPPTGTALDVSTVKDIVGGEIITASRKGEKSVPFRPMCKLIMSTNEPLLVHDDSRGIWSRLIQVPFAVSFEGKEDFTLKAKLLAEQEGILASLVRTCFQWYADLEAGRPPAPPKIVRDCTREFERSQDPLEGFLLDCCKRRRGRPGLRIRGGEGVLSGRDFAL